MNKDIYWLNKDSRTFLERGYLSSGQSPEERIRQIAEHAETILKIDGFADRFESYMHKGWYSLASPIWSNFGTKRGLSISCNGNYISDNMASILSNVASIGMMSKYGAGTSAFFGHLRPRGKEISVGGKSSGPVHFMEMFETITNVVSQSNVRRGSFAAYLPVDHPDIEEFLHIRGEGHPIQNISVGVCISNDWMKEMLDGDKSKRKIWSSILKKRFESGYPYIFFTDNVNNKKPKVYKDKNITIVSSNLCSEIALACSDEESFVCCLSSMNLIHWDDWKDTDAVETLTFFLDAVMEDYIDQTRDIKFMDTAYNFAINQRAIGLGVLGWHSFLQSKMIAFESTEAKILNATIFKYIDQETLKASKKMAELYGEAPLLKGYGLRNATRTAIAPTTSSSFILGQVSQSIEPLNSNYFTKDLAKGKFTYKNPYLAQLLESHNRNEKVTWDSILQHGGSVQHLEFLTQEEKDVFKTFGEISQMEVVIQAIQRQKYIDQSQSLNLMIHPDTSPKEMSKLLIYAWENGIKTLYYQRSANPSQMLNRNLLNCVSCEG